MTRPPRIGALLIAAAVLISACGRSGAPQPHIGYVEADWIYVAAPGAGWIETRPAHEGLQVKAGDVLFTLDAGAEEAAFAEAEARAGQSLAQVRNIETGARPAEIAALQARLAEAEARQQQARLERDRAAALAERGIASKAQADRSETDLRAADASVEAARQTITVARLAGRQAERDAARALDAGATAAQAGSAWRLGQRTIRARSDGRVEEVFLEAGEYAMPGMPVLALQPADGLKVRFFVPQAELDEIAPGGEISLQADGMHKPIRARIRYIASRAEFTPPVIYASEERDKLVFLVEAGLPAGTPLRPGTPVEVAW